MKDELNKDRLGKLVSLAKKGVGGEKETAIRMVKKLCEKYELSFDDVIGEGDSVQEFYLDCPRSMERLLAQVVVSYAYDGDATMPIHNSIAHTRIYFETTKARYIETAHAWSILLRLYQKEQKRMKDVLYHAFLAKHGLYANKVAKPRDYSELSDEEKRARSMGGALAEGLEDAEIRRALEAGK